VYPKRNNCRIDGHRWQHPRNRSRQAIRDAVVTWEGNIASLRRFKDDVSEVREGFECGIGLENFNDIKVGVRSKPTSSRRWPRRSFKEQQTAGKKRILPPVSAYCSWLCIARKELQIILLEEISQIVGYELQGSRVTAVTVTETCAFLKTFERPASM